MVEGGCGVHGCCCAAAHGREGNGTPAQADAPYIWTLDPVASGACMLYAGIGGGDVKEKLLYSCGAICWLAGAGVKYAVDCHIRGASTSQGTVKEGKVP